MIRCMDKCHDFETFHRALGSRMRELRRAHGLSQEKLAELLELDRTTVGYYEQARRVPSLQVLYKMAGVLEMPVGAFFSD
jgi:putative transcriptional regulator